MGVAEELPQEGWFGRRGRELPRPEARERHPRIDHRSRLAVVQESYGKESHLAYLGHALVENRNGLIAAAMATQADGYAEREAALLMLEEKQKATKVASPSGPTRPTTAKTSSPPRVPSTSPRM